MCLSTKLFLGFSLSAGACGLPSESPPRPASAQDLPPVVHIMILTNRDVGLVGSGVRRPLCPLGQRRGHTPERPRVACPHHESGDFAGKEGPVCEGPLRPRLRDHGRHASQAQTSEGGGRRISRGQDQPHPQVRVGPPLPPTACQACSGRALVPGQAAGDRGRWEGVQEIGRQQAWAESVASWEPGDGQAVPLPCAAGGHGPLPIPGPPLAAPLAAAASATELLLAAHPPRASVPSCGHRHLASPGGRLPVACSPTRGL